MRMSDSQDDQLSRGYRKVREGLVVSDKMDKTVVVMVEDRVKHPKYGKVIRRTKRYKAHDGANECGVGDRVLLMETRPLSATKRWRVAQILEKAKYPAAARGASSAGGGQTQRTACGPPTRTTRPACGPRTDISPGPRRA